MTQPVPQPRFTIEQLANLLDLYEHIMGKKPTELEVSLAFFDFYKQQVEKTMEMLGVKTQTLTDEEVTFSGIRLIKGK